MLAPMIREISLDKAHMFRETRAGKGPASFDNRYTGQQPGGLATYKWITGELGCGPQEKEPRGKTRTGPMGLWRPVLSGLIFLQVKSV
jgi:hypothetical protein